MAGSGNKLTLLPLASVAILALAACQNGYYAQSIRGHLDLLSGRERVERLVASPDTPEDLRAQLILTTDIRAFAATVLALPGADSYTTYVDLGRDYVTMNVVATPELSLRPLTWCFPVFGCVAYRGYFDQADAVAYGNELRAAGLDVAIGGSSAYSTLGWFRDPLLNTMLYAAPYRIAGNIFPELAHQRLYIPNDSAFNESYAVAVERAGVRLWLDAVGSPELFADYERSTERQEDFVRLVLGAKGELEALYASAVSDQDKRRGKAAIIAALRADYQDLRASWGGYPGYDGWFAQDLNNAHFAGVATYNTYVAAFTELLDEVGGDFALFHAAVAGLGRLDPAERAATLERLGAAAGA
ncbi:MAG: aminopeptidase [Bauldia sp.]